MMEELFRALRQECRVLKKAPWSVAVIVVVAFALGGWAMFSLARWISEERVEIWKAKYETADRILTARQTAGTMPDDRALKHRALDLADRLASSVAEAERIVRERSLPAHATAAVVNIAARPRSEVLACEMTRVEAKALRQDILNRLPVHERDSKATRSYYEGDCLGELGTIATDLKRLALALRD